VRVGFKTDVGRFRMVNEDNLLVDQELGLFIVADGMGSHEAGELASSITTVEIANYVRDQIRLGNDPESVIIEAMYKANVEIVRSSVKNTDIGGMGSTVVMALFVGERVFIAHVGDSRAYLIKDEEIEQLTHDHSFVADWVEEGRITIKEARTHPSRHKIYSVLGIDAELDIEIAERPWENSLGLMLCSDGLTDMLDDDEIRLILQLYDDPQVACNHLVNSANEKGGEDNITVILIC
jgi:PPM family protein phosphatase